MKRYFTKSLKYQKGQSPEQIAELSNENNKKKDQFLGPTAYSISEAQ